MPTRVAMPQLGESVVEGVVARWLVKEGDSVERDQPLLEVETDKATVEVPAPAAGVVARILVAEGQAVGVGALLCEIGEGGEATVADTPSGGLRQAPSPASTSIPPASPAPAPASASAPAPKREARSSPVVRNLAREHGVELGKIDGTGEGGRVTKDDVMRQVEARKASAAPPAATAAASPPSPAALAKATAQSGANEEVIPWSRRRKLIAEHMVASKRVAPHVACVAEVDLVRVVRLREAHRDERISFTAAVAAATARALREEAYRRLNATIRGESTVLLGTVNLGIAVDAEDGLLVPVIRHAQRLAVVEMARAIEDVATRARAKKILPDELSGGTFTISNPGPRGNLYGTAIINQPQVGILRMGEIVKRAVVITEGGEDRIAVRPMMYLCLSYDHRVVDGVLGNGFLRRVKEILEEADFGIGS